MSRGKQYLAGVRAGLPVVLGFIPVGIAYAMMAGQSGLSISQTVMMSVLVFAGSSQMMAAGMFAQGAGIFAVVITTFILNFRHLMMSTCVMNRLKGTKAGMKLLLAFGITDESFAIFTTMDEEKCSSFFFFGLISTTYSSWIAGTVIGCVASQFLPTVVSGSLGIALYAMFIGLLVPNVKKSLRLGIVVLITAVINLILSRFMLSSWAIIFATLISAAIGVVIVENEEDVAVAE
ncbi:autotransporter [Clostridium polyendosporum]|uniref:Autotransporter n=2 Tax=Clostridium polyendosporum TaxID=69208 RepID=A0A919VDT6_9CLOT|nr:autotransporter [Clostridium polyendosporum]